MSAALQTFHEKIRSFNLGLPPIGKIGSAVNLMPVVADVLDFPLGSVNYLENWLEKDEDFFIPCSSEDFLMGMSENGPYTFQSSDDSKIIDITFEDCRAQYRVAGFVQHITLEDGTPHAISYVSTGGRWYCCNDSLITPLESIQGISVTAENPIILVRANPPFPVNTHLDFAIQ